MTQPVNNSPQHIVHQIDNHGQNVVNTLDTVVNTIFFHPLKGLADGMKNFNIPPIPQAKMNESSLEFTISKIRNRITDYHSYIIRESARKSGVVEKKVYTCIKCILYPFKLFKTTDALREIVATKIAFAVRFLALASIQAVGHTAPYIVISTLITAGMYIYTLNPLALTGIFTGALLIIQIYVLHLLVEIGSEANKRAEEIAHSVQDAKDTFVNPVLAIKNTISPPIRLVGRIFSWVINKIPYYGSANTTT